MSDDTSSAAPLVDAVPDGERLHDLIATLPVSRDSVFRLLKVLGIETEKGPAPGGKGRVAWISTSDAARLREAAAAVSRGATIASFAGPLVTSPQRGQTPPTLPSEPLAPDSADAGHHADLLQRIEAAEAAARVGFPLSTAELSWIVGVRPGSPIVRRAGLRADRLARNLWRLSVAADSGDRPDPAP